MLFWKRASCRKGFLFLEALIVLAGLAGGLLIGGAAFRDAWEERELDAAADEVASAIRLSEDMAKSGSARHDVTGGYVHFYCTKGADGRVSYSTARGIWNESVKRTLPSSVTCTTNLSLLFRNDAFSGLSDTYSTVLQTKDGKYRRKITVAMYTGRVRVEKL